ncbi:multidrug effflux MFS transporter [Propylenella binzhouense]|uniref:MFS transporter n=1 Tax=Propylenella binzhouense TaxID=2555902 RepID=A0A964WTV0_9HYPH|nr:multidrug effflux MFS transporter [Propylenella binzhouense]MYZ48427.1 MFS transporter [Propylenella binzhouense]
MKTQTTPSFAEFVVLIALMMAVTALGIDNVLPAFGPIGAWFGVTDENRLQFIVYSYMIGFAAMQLFYGPLADVIGRRPTLLWGFGIYALGCVLALLAPSFEFLLLARAVQGMGAAGGRIVSVTIVRDCYAGREMARVMSFTMMIFIVVPVFAPAIGSGFLVLGGWHAIFVGLIAFVIAIMAWYGLRMPETLRPEHRFPFSFARIVDAVRFAVTSRVTIGYTTAMGLMFGSLMGYIGSAQQIFATDVYGLGAYFPIPFGAVAATMGIGSYLNSRLVRRVGTRRMSHAGLCGFALSSAVLVAVSLAHDGRPPLLLFCSILACNLFLFSLTVPNFNAMAMEPLGSIAGTASSFIGFYMTLLGAVLGLGLGQAFDGTVVPLAQGFLAFSLVALVIVLWTEEWRLFQPRQA